ncbi:MAG TPA: class II glutamine amidotransferase [Pyrinomonadaceae bacterium]|nr:class II glutamine amidotransferase [Pyrinomonadaceae bacterium]
MCRFIGYIGRKILLADLILRPQNSLIRQSYKARERSEPLNGDGFGIGWYAPEKTLEPCVFTSITPAWSNRNLSNLAEHIESGCFFSHVRAASPGMLVSEVNCHPFRFGRFLWMHNGTIEGFRPLKRRLRQLLPDELYHAVEGTTDSEHAFMLFLHLLGYDREKKCASDLAGGLVKTIRQLEEWAREAEISQPSIYNFAVTDGQNIATVRYVSDPKIEPISLYFSKRGKYQCGGGKTEIIDCCPDEESGIIIASEKLTDRREDWIRVAPNHILTVGSNLKTKVQLISDF